MNTTLKKKADEWGPQHRTLGKTKMEWMKLHKSTALLVAALVPARLGLRLVKEAPVRHRFLVFKQSIVNYNSS